MKNGIINLSLALLFISFSGRAQKKARGLNEYTEDLSVVRAGLDVTVDTPLEQQQAAPSTTIISADTVSEEKTRDAHTVNEQVDAVLDDIAKLRKAARYINGYTIQIYAGQSRQEAIEARSQIVTAINEKKEQELEAINEQQEQDLIAIDDQELTTISDQQDQELTAINEQKDHMLTIINKQQEKKSEVILYYNQPNFLVTMGDYFSQLEAQKDLFQIKSFFPKAILVPKKIPITKRRR